MADKWKKRYKRLMGTLLTAIDQQREIIDAQRKALGRLPKDTAVPPCEVVTEMKVHSLEELETELVKHNLSDEEIDKLVTAIREMYPDIPVTDFEALKRADIIFDEYEVKR